MGHTAAYMHAYAWRSIAATRYIHGTVSYHQIPLIPLLRCSLALRIFSHRAQILSMQTTKDMYTHAEVLT